MHGLNFHSSSTRNLFRDLENVPRPPLGLLHCDVQWLQFSGVLCVSFQRNRLYITPLAMLAHSSRQLGAYHV